MSPEKSNSDIVIKAIVPAGPTVVVNIVESPKAAGERPVEK